VRTRSAPLHALAIAADAVARLTARKLGLAVVYHAVGPVPGAPSRELVPALHARLFEEQVRDLKRRYRLVRAAALPAAARSRRRGQRFPLAITLDDDLASHAEEAAPILRRHRIPATFFLTGATLRGPRTFWWERLQAALDRGLGLDDPLLAPVRAHLRARGAPTIHEIGEGVRMLPAAERDALSVALLRRIGGEAHGAGLRAAQVRALAADGFEVAFHTLRHDSLPELDDEALARGLTAGRAALAEVAGRLPATIAYPHGRADARVAAAARRAGFQAGFTTDPHPFRAGADPLLIGRFEPSHTSTARLALRLARATLRR
jgi:peptidoglycan/xylan/chitin deacetylase (PgdA/CDA1 family)